LELGILGFKETLGIILLKKSPWSKVFWDLRRLWVSFCLKSLLGARHFGILGDFGYHFALKVSLEQGILGFKETLEG